MGCQNSKEDMCNKINKKQNHCVVKPVNKLNNNNNNTNTLNNKKALENLPLTENDLKLVKISWKELTKSGDFKKHGTNTMIKYIKNKQLFFICH